MQHAEWLMGTGDPPAWWPPASRAKGGADDVEVGHQVLRSLALSPSRLMGLRQMGLLSDSW